MDNINLKKTKDFAEKLAKRVGKFLLEKQDKVEILEFKDKQDILTNIDLQAEKIIVNAISKNFPNHNINSEEVGIIDNNSEFTWVIDPLDGTKEYFRGLPYYSVCISLENRKEILIACIYIPATDELYSAAKGFGAFENEGLKLKVSIQGKLDHAIIAAHPPNHKVKEPGFSKIWNILAKVAKSSYRLRPTAYDNIILCYLAKGAFDAYFVLIEKGPKWWDIAPGLSIAQEAGAKVTNRYGDPLVMGNFKDGIIVSNGKIHDQLLKILKK